MPLLLEIGGCQRIPRPLRLVSRLECESVLDLGWLDWHELHFFAGHVLFRFLADTVEPLGYWHLPGQVTSLHEPVAHVSSLLSCI